MKRANKYVIFNTATGLPILEWGGCYFGINQLSGTYDIYHLGLLPVWHPTGTVIYFFYGGKILDYTSDTTT